MCMIEKCVVKDLTFINVILAGVTEPSLSGEGTGLYSEEGTTCSVTGH